MYTSAEDARSDLFLAGGVFIIGPVVVNLLLDVIPIRRIPGVAPTLAVALPLVYTVLVPYLLIRYRRESVRSYLAGERTARARAAGAIGVGLLLAAPIVAMSVAESFVETAPLGIALPVLLLGEGSYLVVARVLTTWLGLSGLMIYAAAKAREAFRGYPQSLRGTALEVGRWIAIITGVATVLLLLAVRLSLGVVLLPVGVALTVLIAYRRVGRPQPTTTRAVVLTPVILLALGVLALSFDASQLVQGVWDSALLAGVGLAIALVLEARTSPIAVVVLGLTVGLMSRLGLVTALSAGFG